jgi:uroporphyrinogen III methyltransferase/synthase
MNRSSPEQRSDTPASTSADAVGGRPEGCRVGTVYLVGAGPGDAGLITCRGADCLRLADVVVFDSLVSPKLLALAPAGAERIGVGKRHGRSLLRQPEIDHLLVAQARAGRTVVRLKGGDPFVFGRGGEEAATLRRQQIPFEVVPGVTAALGAAACAAIPLTHRALASAVAFVTGHEDPDKPESRIDWPALARFPGTLVFYMGVARLTDVCAALVRCGKPSETPAALVHWATTPKQRTVAGTLADLPARVASERLCPPAIIVVGDVVTLREPLAWFEARPLFGQCIVLTRPRRQAAETVRQLEALGAEVIELPLVRIEPPQSWVEVDAAIDQLERYGWLVFTSSNGVSSFFERLFGRGLDARRLGPVRIATIGPSTADELQRYGLRADLVATEHRSEGLAAQLRAGAPGRPLLLARADRGRDALPQALRDAGIACDELTVYRSVDETAIDSTISDRIARGEVGWIILTSSAIARTLVRLLPEAARAALCRTAPLATLTPVTTATLRELGYSVDVESPDITLAGLVVALCAAATRG